MTSDTHYDVLIIGGGQAGLAAGHFVKQTNATFCILDASSAVGDAWRNRYDSLVLFTPRSYSRLLGLPLNGELEGFPTKDEMTDYLKKYVTYWNLPILHQQRVIQLTKATVDSFLVKTETDTFTANNVIIATGPFQKPSIPGFAEELNDSTVQLHSSAYRNPSQLQEGAVLIVGGGNSGAQIAVELSKDRTVYLAISHPMRFLPLQIGSRSIFTLFRRIGLLSSSRECLIGRWFRKQPDPVFGYELRDCIRQGSIHLKPRVRDTKDDSLLFVDGSSLSVPNIIWSTGYSSDYSWLHIEGALDSNRTPLHKRGVSPVRGLFYVGLPWQHTRSSALVGGVGNDAEYVVSYLTNV